MSVHGDLSVKGVGVAATAVPAILLTLEETGGPESTQFSR